MLLFAHPALRAPDAATTWLATDQAAMLGLLQRNVARRALGGESSAGARLDALPLDWNEALEVHKSGSEARQDRLRRAVFASFEQRPSCADASPDADEPAWPDLILASDCESLQLNPSCADGLTAAFRHLQPVALSGATGDDRRAVGAAAHPRARHLRAALSGERARVPGAVARAWR